MNHSARSSGPQPLAKAIAEVVALRGLAQSGGVLQMASAWKVLVREIVGESAVAQTKTVQLNRGVLQISVSNSALLSEFVSFHKPALVDAFRQRYPDLKVRDLKFRLSEKTG